MNMTNDDFVKQIIKELAIGGYNKSQIENELENISVNIIELIKNNKFGKVYDKVIDLNWDEIFPDKRFTNEW